MPPHCDTMDGPVVKAARMAIEKGNVNLILPYAPKTAEAEIRKAFDKTMKARKEGEEAKDLADIWFFETVVRLHRAGEGAPYTGLKPAGLDEGPVVPRAEEALERGDPKVLIEFLSHVISEQIEKRFHKAMELKDFDENDVDAAREWVEAMLGLTLYSHGVYTFVTGGEAHGGSEEAGGHKH